jgi:hypothetical protein
MPCIYQSTCKTSLIAAAFGKHLDGTGSPKQCRACRIQPGSHDFNSFHPAPRWDDRPGRWQRDLGHFWQSAEDLFFGEVDILEGQRPSQSEYLSLR